MFKELKSRLKRKNMKYQITIISQQHFTITFHTLIHFAKKIKIKYHYYMFKIVIFLFVSVIIY